MRPLWYRNAAIYQIDPTLFRDSNGDGCGDLRGITERLDYIRGLGCTAVWFMPFYQSPFEDAGYDITDHLQVDKRFGDLADIVALLEKAEELGLHVIIELVVQHTSIQHKWFQEARRDRNSPYRDYYIWADKPDDFMEPIFPTVEDSIWTWDEEAGQYYRHLFYKHEPDLDLTNPKVIHEIERIMSFWLRLGVSGFRIDAAVHMVRQAGGGELEKGYWLLEHMRDFVTMRRPETVLLGEIDTDPEKYVEYFGDEADRVTLLLDFWTNNHLFLALARQQAEPLVRALNSQPLPPSHSQYALWIRNHDELSLDRLEEDERKEVMDTFAPDENMRAYDRGIRRRLAPMLDGDERRIAATHALLFSLPGTPIIRYGEEIGMGDDLDRPERLAVRTPMQWSNEPNAGFSCTKGELAAPVIDEGPFSYEKINVFAQTLRSDSLMARTGNMIRTRIGLREIGIGKRTTVEVNDPAVFAIRHDNGSTVLMLVNLADKETTVEITEDDLQDMVDVLADCDYGQPEGSPLKIRLGPYGYRWLRRKQQLFG
ncbi:alpha-amylase family protein [Stutzerimonas kunmingensis]|uniref:alpha-amylase family protein n=1 Tax=Stutzerimonas kunmingensis TaxID=1211807 RepID=UPI0028B1F041|nr:alpha-amylase family protein [Stutzerimonas kunmingensis]